MTDDDLDVERLATAIRMVERQKELALTTQLGIAPTDGPPSEWYGWYASRIAAEYARLAQEAA